VIANVSVGMYEMERFFRFFLLQIENFLGILMITNKSILLVNFWNYSAFIPLSIKSAICAGDWHSCTKWFVLGLTPV